MLSWVRTLFGKSNDYRYIELDKPEYIPSGKQHSCPTCNVLQKMLDEDRARLFVLEDKFLAHLGVRDTDENHTQPAIPQQVINSRQRFDQAKKRFSQIDKVEYDRLRLQAELASQSLINSDTKGSN